MGMAGMGAMAGTAVLGFVPRGTTLQVAMAATRRELLTGLDWDPPPRTPHQALMCTVVMAETVETPGLLEGTAGTVATAGLAAVAAMAELVETVALPRVPASQATAVLAGTQVQAARVETVAQVATAETVVPAWRAMAVSAETVADRGTHHARTILVATCMATLTGSALVAADHLPTMCGISPTCEGIMVR